MLDDPAMTQSTSPAPSTTVVEMWTDGACKGNPGSGGWGAWMRAGSHERELWGGEAHTTNNRMELMAVIQGLRALNRPCQVTLHVDSSYVMNGMTKWLAGWKRNGWRTGDKKPVKNKELCRSSRPRSRGTTSDGSGSRATPVIPGTSGPTSSRTAASTRCAGPDRAPPGPVPDAAPLRRP